MRLCKDCKWSRTLTWCANPRHGTNLMRGGEEVRLAYHIRSTIFPFDILFRHCGKRGRWWEPKE